MSDIEKPADAPDNMQFTRSERPDSPANVIIGNFEKIRENAPVPGENPVPAVMEPPAPRFVVGDWVRFYIDKTLAIARVEYIRQDPSGALQLLTSIGALPEQAVLEIRRGGK